MKKPTYQDEHPILFWSLIAIVVCFFMVNPVIYLLLALILIFAVPALFGLIAFVVLYHQFKEDEKLQDKD